MILKLKNVFHQHKRPILITNLGIDKTVVPNKVPFGKKVFKDLNRKLYWNLGKS